MVVDVDAIDVDIEAPEYKQPAAKLGACRADESVNAMALEELVFQ